MLFNAGSKVQLCSLFFASAASFCTLAYADNTPPARAIAKSVSWSTTDTSAATNSNFSTENADAKNNHTPLHSHSSLHVNQHISDLIAAANDQTNTPNTPSALNQQNQIAQANEPANPQALGPVINFNNVSITEFLRFVSRLTGKNFIFDPQLLQFPVTIISETPATLEDVFAALLQNLRVHGFYLVEEGNNFLIHQTTAMRAPAGILHEDENGNLGPEIATAVFQVANVSPARIATILKTMASTDAIVETMEETMRVVVTDILANIEKFSDLIKKLDTPNSGLEIGQYVALNNSPVALISVAQRIITPVAADKTLILVPYQASNSIFIISTPYLVEKTLSVLQSLDLNQTTFGLLNLDQMKFDIEAAKQAQEKRNELSKKELQTPIPLTQEEIDSFTARERNAILQAKGFTSEQISKLSSDQVTRILREKGLSKEERQKIFGEKKGVYESELPLGQAESTQFFIHRMQYRKAEDVVKALQAIAASLSGSVIQAGPAAARNTIPPSDLVVTLNSVQAITENNALVFTGTRSTLARAKELINQIDIPVRQVLIEALVLDTTIANTLNFGVEWAGKYQSKNYAYSAGFLNGPGSGGQSSIQVPLQQVTLPNPVPTVPPTTMNALNLGEGLSGGAIGRQIKHNGTAFRAFSSFINFLRTDEDVKLVLNPKIVTEHNVPAEIFVGQQIPIKGQSIVNSTANNSTNTVSTNYETVQTGVDLKVTPLISSGDTVTLIIQQTISNANSTQVANQGNNNAPPATINETRTTTRVHMPSNYFLFMSGMLQTQISSNIDTIPLLGGLPIIGFFFNNKNIQDSRRNIIMYIRPRILDTPIDIEQITQNEERVYDEACDRAGGWRKQLNDLKELLNF
ncbi:MAG: hypothetical protein LLF94_08265 [Chlamydiales bacterium]|nr:hypothetical protein [Chlamydiales bacterium]